jgi:hypothetical protein
MILKDYDNQINFFCVMCINGVHDTSPNVPARVVPVIPGSFQRLSTGSITYAEKFTCPCGIGKITDESGLCPLSPASTYQPVEGGLTAIRCPEHSHSAPGSDSWTDCKCIDGFTPEPEYNAVGEQTSFKCFCRPGYYFSGTACVKCEICDPLTYPGYYKHGCGKLSAGECKKCEDCTNNKYRAGCRFFSAGECKNKHELVRMPFCPAVQTDNSELAVSVRQASGLGAFSFEQVFGTDAQGADFACSQPCDGVEYDTIQCDGPFACNVKTCAEKTLVGELPRACPVVIDEDDDRSMRDSKRGEACVVCSECGHANVNLRNGVGAKYNYYKHWGGGCVRECSKLMCTDNEIWDWTARRCQRCSQLRDIRLCNQGDRVSLSLQARTVTGNWPLLFFPECEGTSASKKLESFKYGVCAVCDAGSNKQELCASASEFPASCKDSQVLCESCHRGGRAGSAQAVEVFKGLWHNALSSAFEPLHCQISACTEGWTGVGSADNMCTQLCEDVECTANEVSVPCRLPHQARCEAVFPGPPKGHPGGFQVENDEQYADGEVNLLNEVDDMKHRRFASFENALIVLGNAETEYQCVWNADGIFDSKTSPGGITSVFWRAGMSDDDAFKTRGTQACRVWDVDGGVELPLLPLQNTISASEIQERFNISVRRMLVNTEAYVLSYRFGGSFATPETDNVHGAFADSDHTPGERMLRGAHVGGAGRLFLMLRLHEDKATVAVTLPSDRRLHEAMWVQALLVSFAIVDVTQYFGKEESGVTVNAGMTAGGQHINDLGDNFILESFWVQELPEALSLQAQSSLFRLEVWDYASANADIAFNTWSRCSNTDMLALKILDMQVAPFIPVAASLAYSWVEAKAESAMPYNVSISCFKGAILVPDSQCIPVKDATAVYVRPKPYVYSGSSGPAICPECTTDRTLRALRNVHEHMRGVRADQHVGSAGLVRYLLNQFARRMLMLHAHAWDPFGKCIALITTVDTMHNSVLCIGAEEAVELARLPVSGPDQYIGAFGYAIDAKKHVFMLLKGRATRSTKLVWRDDATQQDHMVNTGVMSSHWVSVCASAEQIIVLCINNNNQLEVRWYRIQLGPGQPPQLLLSETSIPSFLNVTYVISSAVEGTDAWLKYSRVAVCGDASCTGAFVAAAVRQVQVEARNGEPGGARLLLTVCSGKPGLEAACSNSTLPVSADSPPSFISVAFLRASSRTQHWVVGVFGHVFSVDTADLHPRVQMRVRLDSTLRDRHFLKAGPLFYTINVLENDASSSEILAYLDGFERLRNNASLPVVYGVVVVPKSRAVDLSSPPVADPYTPPQAVLRLGIHRASYHVETASGPGLPVYKRTDELVKGNERTQLLFSKHTEEPFAQHRAGFIASYGGAGLNLRVALPHAFGRYEMHSGECKFTDTSLHSTNPSLGINMRLRSTTSNEASWLLLQFEVPCGAMLSVTCALTPLQMSVRCPKADVVVVVHTQQRKATVYYVKAGEGLLPTVVAVEHEDIHFSVTCIFLGAGVAWVNSVGFDRDPGIAEARRRLLRSAELQQQQSAQQSAVPVSSSWRRERRVITLNPVEHMRLELLFQRDARFEQTVSVGVDDVQLAPVLSSVPPQRGMSDRSALCALVYVPSVAELTIIGLQTLVVAKHWQRLHVTVSLERAVTNAADTPCSFVARLFRATDNACPAWSEQHAGLQRAGCRALEDSHGVRGAYAECQLEVPLGIDDLAVAVHPESASAECALSAADSLVVWLRPYTALYSCSAGQFRDAAGECINCHDSESVDSCPRGRRLSGCPALQHAPSQCVECVEGADVVALGTAEWVQTGSSICAWQCKDKFFRIDSASAAGACAPCSATEQCPPGERWQPCDALQDGRCVQCPAPPPNAVYVAGCEPQCETGYYKDTDGRCKRCWDRTELVLHASLQLRFFALFNCTATTNAVWRPCVEEPGARVVGSDPGAGTDEEPFTGSCVLECQPGWRRRDALEPGEATCVKCEHPRRVERGLVTARDLQPSAFAWLPQSCDFTCLSPWRSTRARGGAIDTCVLCEQEDGGYLCTDGEYPTGPYCECRACEK